MCPACNGLVVLEEYCPNCREIMEESSSVTEELDPYAPYEFQHIEKVSGAKPYSVNSESKDNSCHKNNDCIHEVVCPNCEITWNISINKVTL